MSPQLLLVECKFDIYSVWKQTSVQFINKSNEIVEEYNAAASQNMMSVSFRNFMTDAIVSSVSSKFAATETNRSRQGQTIRRIKEKTSGNKT